MDKTQKIDLLAAQIAEAKSGNPANFELWRQKTEVVLRNVVGDANPLYEAFKKIRYGLSMFTSDTPASAWDRARAAGVQQGISILEAAKLEVELSGGRPEPDGDAVLGGATGSDIFIVHGHDDARKHELARFLRALTSREPVILHEQANSGRTIIEKFEDHAAEVAYAVVIATADDLGRAKGDADDLPRARQNVIFELGFFFGSLGRSRVACLYDENVDRPSDTDGLVYIPIDAAGGWKTLLSRELDRAGIGVDWSALK